MNAWDTNPWRELHTAQLLRELDCRKWDLADVDANADRWDFAPESRAFLVATIRDINAEISRRRSLATRPNAPAWPDQPRDPKAELEEIKRRVSVIDLIHREMHREYERRGEHDIWLCCPLPGHDERTPSFHVDTKRQVWHCFGCGRGGDLFELARHLWGEGLFYRVAERLRDYAGLNQVVETTPKGPGLMRPDGSSAHMRVAAPARRGYARG